MVKSSSAGSSREQFIARLLRRNQEIEDENASLRALNQDLQNELRSQIEENENTFGISPESEDNGGPSSCRVPSEETTNNGDPFASSMSFEGRNHHRSSRDKGKEPVYRATSTDVGRSQTRGYEDEDNESGWSDTEAQTDSELDGSDNENDNTHPPTSVRLRGTNNPQAAGVSDSLLHHFETLTHLNRAFAVARQMPGRSSFTVEELQEQANALGIPFLSRSQIRDAVGTANRELDRGDRDEWQCPIRRKRDGTFILWKWATSKDLSDFGNYQGIERFERLLRQRPSPTTPGHLSTNSTTATGNQNGQQQQPSSANASDVSPSPAPPVTDMLAELRSVTGVVKELSTVVGALAQQVFTQTPATNAPVPSTPNPQPPTPLAAPVSGTAAPKMPAGTVQQPSGASNPKPTPPPTPAKKAPTGPAPPVSSATPIPSTTPARKESAGPTPQASSASNPQPTSSSTATKKVPSSPPTPQAPSASNGNPSPTQTPAKKRASEGAEESEAKRTCVESRRRERCGAILTPEEIAQLREMSGGSEDEYSDGDDDMCCEHGQPQE
ncbi:hypothetical protein HK097_008038 [Rhizophlyctis rosea]|uniref:Uncharacterized protein n=1 Tax=Rhizophlyctis rosea TaxID=64517 RepID=A0AAD5SK45_9FUNG|nr:hypothetical protein HK097_008038 [Rhizophlyctis rosea]